MAPAPGARVAVSGPERPRSGSARRPEGHRALSLLSRGGRPSPTRARGGGRRSLAAIRRHTCPRRRILGDEGPRASRGIRRLPRPLRGGQAIPKQAKTTELDGSEGSAAAPSKLAGRRPNGATTPADRRGHTRVGAGRGDGPPVAPLTESAQALADDERALLGDLLAVIEEHSLEGSRRIDAEATERAFAFACERHADQRRRTGEDFITHPVEVAKICAGLRLDTETLCAALLHDTVEDTSASLDQVEGLFGDSVAQLVDGVTKLTEITFQSRDDRQAENYRKMMVAMATDLRVILIKLADRLHNMRTVSGLPKQKQIDKARETLEIYAPLAHRLGIHAIKWELEDLSFQRLHPRKYEEIKKLVSQQRAERERYVDDAGRFLKARAEEGRHRGRDLGARQALLLDLLEDDQEGAGVQRDLRPHRDARAGGLGQGLLRGDRDHPFDLEAAAGAVQGPDRDPEDEPLPGAPHDGHWPRGTAARDPDPHPGDARDRRVRDRRPRHLQGGRAPEGRSRAGRR